MVEAITTFNRSGLELYGRRMVASFLENWPSDYELIIYAEGWKENELPEHPQMRIRDLLESSDWLADFKKRHKKRKVAGMPWDAVRFSHKVAAICHAFRKSSSKYVIWLDADTLTHSRVDASKLEKLFPDDWHAISWLERRKRYPECGFYVLNRTCEDSYRLMVRFETMYREDKLFELEQWHDSYVLWSVARKLKIPCVNISGVGYDTSHPFINSPLGEWMDHMKGDRKIKGKSRKRDLVERKQGDYWNDWKGDDSRDVFARKRRALRSPAGGESAGGREGNLPVQEVPARNVFNTEAPKKVRRRRGVARGFVDAGPGD